jgi:hypothetical protein
VAREPEVGDDAYAAVLEAVERLFLDQKVRISAETEAARVAAEESDFKDHRSISRSVVHAVQISWEADEQVASLKRRLDELYEERVVEPIMETRRLTYEMDKLNSKRFQRRVTDHD